GLRRSHSPHPAPPPHRPPRRPRHPRPPNRPHQPRPPTLLPVLADHRRRPTRPRLHPPTRRPHPPRRPQERRRMTRRHTVDTITDDELDALYEQLAAAKAAIARVRKLIADDPRDNEIRAALGEQPRTRACSSLSSPPSPSWPTPASAGTTGGSGPAAQPHGNPLTGRALASCWWAAGAAPPGTAGSQAGADHPAQDRSIRSGPTAHPGQ